MSSIGKTSEKNINFSKGILFVFFSIFLIVYGIFLDNFYRDYPIYNEGKVLPLYISYIPLVCYTGAVFMGIVFLIFLRNVTVQKSREIQSRKQVKAGSIYKEALFLVIFLLAFVPLLSPIIDHGTNNQYNSIYNSEWNGASDFAKTIEDEGYEIMSVQSSLSATERLNKSILLILLGPNQFYDPIFEVPYFIDFFNGSNSLLICHDHGSTSTLLWEVLIASMFDPDISIPLTIFPDGILRDNASYDTTPEFPVIQNFAAHPTTANIDEVILSVASCAVGGPFIEAFGWTSIGSTTDYGFIDKDNNKSRERMRALHHNLFDVQKTAHRLTRKCMGDYFPDNHIVAETVDMGDVTTKRINTIYNHLENCVYNATRTFPFFYFFVFGTDSTDTRIPLLYTNKLWVSLRYLL